MRGRVDDTDCTTMCSGIVRTGWRGDVFAVSGWHIWQRVHDYHGSVLRCLRSRVLLPARVDVAGCSGKRVSRRLLQLIRRRVVHTMCCGAVRRHAWVDGCIVQRPV